VRVGFPGVAAASSDPERPGAAWSNGTQMARRLAARARVAESLRLATSLTDASHVGLHGASGRNGYRTAGYTTVAAKVWALAVELVGAGCERCGVATVCADGDRLSSWAGDGDGAGHPERHVQACLKYELAVHGSVLLRRNCGRCWIDACRRRLSMARSAGRHDRDRDKRRRDDSVVLHDVSVSLGGLLREWFRHSWPQTPPCPS
jgi:hypothetical protein